jgi:transposase
VRQCVDPFHVIAQANKAIDQARLWDYNRFRALARAEPKQPPGRRPGNGPRPPSLRPQVRWVKNTRWALVKDPARLTPKQREVLDQLRRSRSVLYRCWDLKETLRDLYRLEDPADAPAHFDWWLARASRSRIPAFVDLAKLLRKNRERILDAVELGLSNSKLEGLNSKIRLINHRGYGHHSPAALIAMIYLCAGGITIDLPLR